MALFHVNRYIEGTAQNVREMLSRQFIIAIHPSGALWVLYIIY
jgi:hypothetical protein